MARATLQSSQQFQTYISTFFTLTTRQRLVCFALPCCPTSCLMHHCLRSSRYTVLSAWLSTICSILSLKDNEWKWTGQSDKATLHQSAIELRGSTVVSASRGLLVDVCPTPMHEMVLLLFYCVILPLLVCLNSDATFSFFLSRVQLASELWLSSDRYSFICTVLSLGWCNDFKRQ